MKTKIYIADVDALEEESLFQKLYAEVSPQRREKVNRVHSAKDKRLSLGAGVLLERALCAEGLQDNIVATEKNGKPCLLNHPDVHFNLSHSGAKVMCAVSDREIGCDVEEIRDARTRIAKRFFAEQEYDALVKCEDPTERNNLFFRYWTLKESFMKATGFGFSLPLSAFCIHVDGGTVSVLQNVDDREYHFCEPNLGDGYRYAVCSVDKPLDDLCVTVVSF